MLLCILLLGIVGLVYGQSSDRQECEREFHRKYSALWNPVTVFTMKDQHVGSCIREKQRLREEERERRMEEEKRREEEAAARLRREQEAKKALEDFVVQWHDDRMKQEGSCRSSPGSKIGECCSKKWMYKTDTGNRNDLFNGVFDQRKKQKEAFQGLDFAWYHMCRHYGTTSKGAIGTSTAQCNNYCINRYGQVSDPNSRTAQWYNVKSQSNGFVSSRSNFEDCIQRCPYPDAARSNNNGRDTSRASLSKVMTTHQREYLKKYF